MATGIMAATAIHDGLGNVNMGSAKNPLLAVSGNTLKRSTSVVILIINAVIHPTIGPRRSGICPANPFKYTENSMVDIIVTSETIHAILVAKDTRDSGTASVPAASIAMDEASCKAVPARVSPITIAMGPVMDAGRIFSMVSCPNRLTINPAAIDTKPDMTIPNCAIAILSFSA